MKIKNKLTVLLISILFGLNLVGCKSEMIDYEGEEGVYFAVQYGASWGDSTLWSYYPVSKVDFVKYDYNVKDVVYNIRVMSMGEIKNYDRTFRMVVLKDSTTAIVNDNYDKLAEDYVIKAGTHYLDIPIKLHRHSDLSVNRKRLALQLVPTTDFSLPMPIWNQDLPPLWTNDEYPKFDNTMHMIELSDILVRPFVWSGTRQDVEIGAREGGTLGQFSAKKFILMCEVMESLGNPISYDDFSEENKLGMPGTRQMVIGAAMVRYLTELYDAKTPVLDEDGRLMWFNGAKWASYIGVPYIPEY